MTTTGATPSSPAASEAGEVVHLEVDRGIATITLDSPANRNALSRRLVTELAERFDRAQRDESVRAVVLTATGPAFCSGADLKEQRAPVGESAPSVPAVPNVLLAIMRAPMPVVAKLNGPARAGGIGLVAASDIAIAPRSATFAFTEVRIGVVPAIIAVPIIRRLHPRAVSRWFLTGESFTAEQAAADGLLTLATDDVDAACEEVLAGFRRAEPAALVRTKALLGQLPALDLADGFTLAASVSAQFFASEAAQEGMAAFAEKRTPRWVL